MEAVILAGGLGTRLKEVIVDIPKPMAPINGRPFLEYILDYLSDEGIHKVIIAVCNKFEVIRNHFKNNYKDISITYSIEQKPLGTGGGLKKAMESVEDNDVFIINGDTYFKVNLHALFRRHKEKDADITIALRRMKNYKRYGTVQTVDSKVVKFTEKKPMANGTINGGIYLAKHHIFNEYSLPECFSLEKDFLERHLKSLRIASYVSDGYFIDIGIQEDYERAQIELQKHR